MSKKLEVPTEKKVTWQVRLYVKESTKQRILDEAQRDDRNYSRRLSKLVEENYGELRTT